MGVGQIKGGGSVHFWHQRSWSQRWGSDPGEVLSQGTAQILGASELRPQFPYLENDGDYGEN